jgi:ubiquinone/menaquinone biosynthesis C-methylase UbiE
MTTHGTDYDGRMAVVYDKGRSLPSSTLAAWVGRAKQHLPIGADLVLDLGAGTGRFSEALAEGLSVKVVAMEPAQGMRAQAARFLTSPRVHVLAGDARRLPFACGCVDLVWASQVLHHVPDLDQCAQEIRRILKPAGRLLVRASLDSSDWLLAPFFPPMLAAGSGLPDRDRYIRVFRAAGLDLLAHEQVSQAVAADGWSLIERTKLRADSVLARLSEDDFAQGLADLTGAVERGEIPSPVMERIDLLIFQPSGIAAVAPGR